MNKKLNALVFGLALAIPSITQAATSIGIEGSPHDMSTNSVYTVWNTRNGVCSPCHSAHNTDPNQIAPLWNHKTTTTVFTKYASPTMNAAVSAPSGSSLACLSCHDGTVGINQSITSTNAPVYIDAGAVIGDGTGDLHTTHPISFTYDAALAAADGELEDPTTYKIGDTKTKLTINVAPVPTAAEPGSVIKGKTINEAMLFGGKMECSSCHDVHKMAGYSPNSGILTRISGNDSTGRGSTLCRTCHIK